MTLYLNTAEVLAIHEDQIRKYGGASGIRDHNLLEAAIFRPQTGYYNHITEEAASLWESLGQNHPFTDGNKRTSFACMYTFLAVNNFRITAEPDETYDFIIGLYNKGEFDFDRLHNWLESNTNEIT